MYSCKRLATPTLSPSKADPKKALVVIKRIINLAKKINAYRISERLSEGMPPEHKKEFQAAMKEYPFLLQESVENCWISNIKDAIALLARYEKHSSRSLKVLIKVIQADFRWDLERSVDRSKTQLSGDVNAAYEDLTGQTLEYTKALKRFQKGKKGWY